MKAGNNIEKRVAETLNSLDGIQRAEPQPWLYARIMKKLALEEDRTVWGSVGSFLARPAVAIVGLCLILVLNGFLLFNEEKQSEVNLTTEQTIESESLVASSSSFEYENLVQQ